MSFLDVFQHSLASSIHLINTSSASSPTTPSPSCATDARSPFSSTTTETVVSRSGSSNAVGSARTWVLVVRKERGGGQNVR